MQLEATLHRIGGNPAYPRQFGPWPIELTQSAVEHRILDAFPTDKVSAWMELDFEEWAPVNDDWLSCRIRLTDMNGCPLATRPVMIYRKPYHVPAHSLFESRYPEDGVFSLALRALAAC